MTRSAATSAEARFKMLCSSGLGGEAAMPALLDELRRIIPFFAGHFFFADTEGRLANAYLENPESAKVTPVFMEHFHGRPDRDLGPTFTEAIRSVFGVEGTFDVLKRRNMDLGELYRSDWYNLLLRPLHVDPGICLVVRHGGRGRALGTLSVHRSPGERGWTPEERRRLASIEPFLAHLLSEGGSGDAPLVDSDRKGHIVADAMGKPLYLSTEGRRLLYLATYPRVAPGTKFNAAPVLPPPVARICRNLVRVFSGDSAAPAPAYYHRNVWGGFRFGARWLEGEVLGSGVIGITVTHQEPLPVRLVRRVGELPLSPRQAQVCVLMASGASNESIAGQLGISKHTAIAHGRWIYHKLDVHSRAELVATLLSGMAH
jgi:DNA-binding CsgD family transcriptional regulator